MVAYQVAEISNGAFQTIMGARLGSLRTASILGGLASSVSSFVSPGKAKGALTDVQKQANEDRLRVVKIISSNARNAAGEILPPPPTSSDMIGLRKMVTDVGNRLYEAHPVRQVTEGSLVKAAYERIQKTGDLYSPVPSLANLYG